jgi:hypothetical protein
METIVMKTSRINTILRSAILSSAVATGLFASTTNAQTQISRARIPFAFRAGSKQMPAGLYDISFKSDRLVLFQDRDPGKYVTAFVRVIPSQGGEFRTNGRLMFNRYGDQYFLREVWQRGSADGVTCTPSAEERAILRLQDQQPVTGTQVALDAEPKR